jgi:cobalt/nickel transport system permease protein
MGAAHGHLLHYHGHSLLHRARPEVKLVALLSFVIAVVATPNDWYPAFAGFLALLVVVIGLSEVPPTYLLKRMVVELPFLVFALLMPLVSHGPQVEVLGVGLSRPGLAAAAGLLMKGTLGVLASLTLAATTPPPEILRGLERLRMPSQLVQIMAFMVRYLDVVGDELRRMRVGLTSRGFTARNPLHWPVLARAGGALFIRSYERGERVYLAMVSRGYAGSMPVLQDLAASRGQWLAALSLPAAAALVAATAWGLRP